MMTGSLYSELCGRFFFDHPLHSYIVYVCNVDRYDRYYERYETIQRCLAFIEKRPPSITQFLRRSVCSPLAPTPSLNRAREWPS